MSARGAAAAFAAAYGRQPDGVWAAPGRVNLIGEHTDYNDGFVLPLALDRTTSAAASRRNDRRVRCVSTARDDVVDVALDDVGPGTVTGWAAYALGVLWALREAGVDVPGLDLAVGSDVPLGAGLSSSAALECAVAVAAVDLAGAGIGPTEVALAARRAENEVVGAPTGVMDQMVAMHAAAGSAVLLDCRSLAVRRIPLGLDRHGLTLAVIDTRAAHALADGAYGERRAACERAAKVLGVPALRDATAELVAAAALDEEDRRRARHVVTENARVLAVVDALEAGRVEEIGPLLDASHASLRDDFEVSVAELDVAVAAARAAGALGARMTGGGFGGSAVALLPSGAVDRLREEVRTAYADRGFTPADVFTVTPSDGAHQVH